MPITEEMRNDILSEGLPMFKQGGHVKMAKGGPSQVSTGRRRESRR
jgi:hypothetical protein